MLLVLCMYISIEKDGIQFQGCQKRQERQKEKLKRTQCTYNNNVLKVDVGALWIWKGCNRTIVNSNYTRTLTALFVESGRHVCQLQLFSPPFYQQQSAMKRNWLTGCKEASTHPWPCEYQSSQLLVSHNCVKSEPRVKIFRFIFISS